MSLNYPPRIKQNNFFDFIKKPEKMLVGYLEKYPDIFYFKILNRQAYFIQNPEFVKLILQDNNKKYRKSRAFATLSLFLGNGLLTSEGEFWKRQRRLAQPAFHKKKLAAIRDIIVTSTEEILDGWNSSTKAFDVMEEMATLTIDIVSKALFGADVQEQVNVIWDEMKFLNVAGINRIRNPFTLPIWVPTPYNSKVKRSMKKIDDVVLGIIENRRKSNGGHDDLLAMLMEAKDEETGEQMTDRQLRDEVLTLFVAGHETTVNALSWTLYFLDQEIIVKEKLKKEIKEALQGRKPTFADLPKLPYLHNVIRESMRLRPPVYVIPREAIEQQIIGGYDVPKGMNLVLNVYALHHHPKYWENPEEFIPERFENFEAKGARKYLYFPFGGGPRMCIGNNFAMMELQMILAMIVQRYDWKWTSTTDDIEREFLITLKPKNGIWLQISKCLD